MIYPDKDCSILNLNGQYDPRGNPGIFWGVGDKGWSKMKKSKMYVGPRTFNRKFNCGKHWFKIINNCRKRFFYYFEVCLESFIFNARLDIGKVDRIVLLWRSSVLLQLRSHICWLQCDKKLYRLISKNITHRDFWISCSSIVNWLSHQLIGRFLNALRS